jgi:acyl-CoA hydrolase
MKHKAKWISIDEALNCVKSEDVIVSALAAAEPKLFLSQLHSRYKNVENVKVVTCLPMGKYPYFSDDRYLDHFRMDGWFYSPDMRKMHPKGKISYIPNHLHLSAKKRLFYEQPNIFVGTCSSIDKHGYVSLSLSATYEREMMEKADIVIMEVNKNMPRTFGDTIVSVNEIDYLVEVDYEVPCLPVVEPLEKDLKIGKFIADLVEDGSTLQLGIGGIPNAVAKALETKKNLGIHTEMFTDGMVDLYEKGVITGSEKSLLKQKMVATFALGSKKLYDFIDDNPAVQILRGSYVNDPFVIGQNNKMVSINTTLEVDLSGQCCSESIGHRQFSGTGGQSDTAVGAQRSKGGKSIIALYSTANIRVDGKNERVKVSKIVSSLKKGAAVSLSRNDVDYVVTEYGVASLRGTSMKERVERLIKIAHPEFRDILKKEAEKEMIW